MKLFFKEWRLSRGYSQKKLGQLLGISAAEVSRIENGKRDFNGSYLERFAKACGCRHIADPISRLPTCQIIVLYPPNTKMKFRVADRSRA